MCLNVLSLLVFTKCCICLIHAVLYIIANSLMMPIDHVQLHLIYTVFLQTTRSTSCCSHIVLWCKLIWRKEHEGCKQLSDVICTKYPEQLLSHQGKCYIASITGASCCKKRQARPPDPCSPVLLLIENI